MEPAVSCRQLSRRYGAIEAVSCLDLEVAPGEVFGLLGPDGAGKTTTMRMLTGIVAPTSGSVQVLGRDMARDSEAVKPRIGYMSQRFSLYSDMTAMENLIFFADLYQVAPADREERVSNLLDAARMSPFRDRQAQHLSGGMKQ
ncbi:MAG: ABC transporter ATP-binding protein, partial [Chloroflexi bacterium]|nr:ABC transporter ATP-binding protein [Chloroflexota bacterium]